MKLIAIAASILSLVSAQTFIETLTTGNFTSLLAAVQKANLTDAIAELHDVTVFVPTDEAFEAIKDVELTVEQLQAVLLTHVVTAGALKSTDLTNTTIASLNPEETLDIVVSDGGVSVNGISVVKADVITSQGVAHVIDQVIIPKSLNLTSAAEQTFIEILAAGNFTSLLAAVQKANLTDAIADLKGVTVFVPTNEAFEAIKDVDLTIEQLQAVLLTHVVPAGALKSTDLSNTTIASLNTEEMLDIVVSDGGVSVNGISVVKADLIASQGVAHVIDKVIVPKSLNLTSASDGTANTKGLENNSVSAITASLSALSVLSLLLI